MAPAPRATRVVHVARAGLAAAVAAAAEVVRGGGVVVFPTDTVYGIGCDFRDARAVDRVYALKGRDRAKPLGLYCAAREQALDYCAGDALAERLVRAFLPGALTAVVRRPPEVAAGVVAGLPSVGLRVPAHATCLALLAACGPLAATSANRSGEPAYAGGGDLERLPAADLAIEDGPAPLGRESTVVDVSRGDVRLVREGAVDVAEIEAVLGCIVARGPRGDRA